MMVILSKVFTNMFISVLWVFVTYISLKSHYCFLDTISSAGLHVSQDTLFVFFIHTCLNTVLKFGSDVVVSFFMDIY